MPIVSDLINLFYHITNKKIVILAKEYQNFVCKERTS